MEQTELHQILRSVADLPDIGTERKVTFVGGEPTLSQHFLEDVKYAKKLGLITSMVTNGSRLTEDTMSKLSGNLDLLTISVDSTTVATNKKIGRYSSGFLPTEEFYLKLGSRAREYGMPLKVNTVVNRHNLNEDFVLFISKIKPIRWKVFQVLRISNQNGRSFDNWGISGGEFKEFLSRHMSIEDSGIKVIPENNEEMTGSYAIVSPDGRFVDNSSGIYRYSSRITEVGIERAFSEIAFSMRKFTQRDGIYTIPANAAALQ